MTLIADGLLIAGASAASVYCFVLAGRLRRLMAMDKGLGASIAGLSRQVDELQRAIGQTQQAAGERARALDIASDRAERMAGRLELLLAALHERRSPDAARAPAPRGPSAVSAVPPDPRDPGRSLAASLRDYRRAAG